MKDKYANLFTDFGFKKLFGEEPHTVFIRLFDAAQIACFDLAERQAYENSLKYYRDLKNVTDTAREEGREEGKEEVAKNMLAAGMLIGQIAQLTGLSETHIRSLT